MKRFLVIALVISFLFTGCSVSTTVQKGLELNNFAFCEKINGHRDFVERKNKTFSPSEVVYVYFEVSNFGLKKVGSSFTYHPQIDVLVKGPKGETVIERTTVINEEVSNSTEVPYFYFPINLTFPENSPDGKYNLTIYVKDAFSNGSITQNEQFFLKKGT